MTRRTTSPAHGPARAALAALLLAGATALAGCSGGDGSASPATGAATGGTAGETAAEEEPGRAPSGEAPVSQAPASQAPGQAPPAVPAGTPEAPSGVVPEGWEEVSAGSGPVFALPSGYQTQEVGEVSDGVGVTLYATVDGSVVVQDQRLSGPRFEGAVPEEVLAGGIAGAIDGGGLTAEDQRDFRVAGRPASEFHAPDPSGSGAYVAARFLVDGGAVFGFISTQPDEAAAAAALDQVWDTLRLP